MLFCGIRRVFSTENNAQYETIGAFWDKLSARYGREKLMGLGYNWSQNTITYVIGLKSGIIQNANTQIHLPDAGWKTVSGKTEELGTLYDEIYRDGALQYETETFTESGNCVISYFR